MAEWAYGLTTVPERRFTYYPRTRVSLERAGFEDPVIFVDGFTPRIEYEKNLRVRINETVLGPFSNWYSALTELYLQWPRANLYALFQDDVLFPENLKEYLEKYIEARVDKTGFYLNCYCHRQGVMLAEEINEKGWIPSNDIKSRPNNPKGRGALALVFPNDTVQRLLTSEYLVQYRKAPDVRGWKGIDGAIICAMEKIGYKEYFHYPGLCEHIGTDSAIYHNVKKYVSNRLSHPGQPETGSFVGEDFDCLELLKDHADS